MYSIGDMISNAAVSSINDVQPIYITFTNGHKLIGLRILSYEDVNDKDKDLYFLVSHGRDIKNDEEGTLLVTDRTMPVRCVYKTSVQSIAFLPPEVEYPYLSSVLKDVDEFTPGLFPTEVIEELQDYVKSLEKELPEPELGLVAGSNLPFNYEDDTMAERDDIFIVPNYSKAVN